MASSKINENDLTTEERLAKVEIVVHNILHMIHVPKRTWQDSFGHVHYICIWENNAGPTMIKAFLVGVINKYVSEVRQRVLQNQDESSLLKEYILEWTKYYERAKMLSQPFRSLDIKQQSSSPPQLTQKNTVQQLMLDTWNSAIYEHIKQKLIDSAIKLIRLERTGHVIDVSLVVGVRDSCAILSYKDDSKKPPYLILLEEAYNEELKTFYAPIVAEYVSTNGIRRYTSYVVQKLLEEEDRAKRYLLTSMNENSVLEVIATCIDLMIVSYTDQMINEVQELLREDNMEDLRDIYDLLRRHPAGFQMILPIFEQYVDQIGLLDIRTNAEAMLKDSNKYVERLLELYNRFSLIVERAFNNDPILLTSRDKAYQAVVNNTHVFTTDIPTSVRTGARRVESRCPELLASYCDNMLRKSPFTRRLNAEEIEKLLDNVLLVLKYVNSKDIFMRVYKTHMTRRLLLETSADSGMEELMVDRLRSTGMPAELVNQLSRMFQDIKLSQVITTDFKYANQPTSGPLPSLSVDVLNIMVLTSGSWITQPKKHQICLPSELEEFLPQIEEFYAKKHKGRNLIWQHHLSHGLMMYTSDRGRVELELRTYQLVVLYVWYQRFDSVLSLDSMLTATGLEDSELRHTLWTLCENPKLEQQLILYTPKVAKEGDFNESTEFRLNLNFNLATGKSGKGQHRRHLNLIGRLQLNQDMINEEERAAIIELRQMRAQEAIVKILKARKELHYNELYRELVDLLRSQFVPSKKLIKEVIEWLIDHQYLCRHKNDKNIFIYVT